MLLKWLNAEAHKYVCVHYIDMQYTHVYVIYKNIGVP